MGYLAKRYSSCEFDDNWEDRGFKQVTGKGGKGRVVVHGVVNRKVLVAKQDDASIHIVDDRAAETTPKFNKGAIVLFGEHTISYRPEEMMKPPEPAKPTRGTA